jgi:phosphatidylglycerol---prolipoprotein diacylglyceryl transferase
MNISDSSKYWTHDLSPFLYQFPDHWPYIGENGIRYYALAYITGFLIAYFLLILLFQKKRSPYNPDQVSDLVTFNILGIIVGGRLGYMLFYDFGGFVQSPISFFYFWNGGMASHGGMIGVAVATILYVKYNRQSLLDTADIIASVSAPGLFFGRISNFINGELWGHPSDVPWAVIFPLADRFPRHPSQLYEALGEGILLFGYIQLRFWGKLGRIPPKGQIAGEFLLAYSVVRMVCETFREPDAALILGITRGQFYSIGTLIAGLGFILYARTFGKSRS